MNYNADSAVLLYLDNLQVYAISFSSSINYHLQVMIIKDTPPHTHFPFHLSP